MLNCAEECDSACNFDPLSRESAPKSTPEGWPDALPTLIRSGVWNDAPRSQVGTYPDCYLGRQATGSTQTTRWRWLTCQASVAEVPTHGLASRMFSKRCPPTSRRPPTWKATTYFFPVIDGGSRSGISTRSELIRSHSRFGRGRGSGTTLRSIAVLCTGRGAG
jgi:hypothetical protein